MPQKLMRKLEHKKINKQQHLPNHPTSGLDPINNSCPRSKPRPSE